jgi:hypothetical protein
MVIVVGTILSFSLILNLIAEQSALLVASAVPFVRAGAAGASLLGSQGLKVVFFPSSLSSHVLMMLGV